MKKVIIANYGSSRQGKSSTIRRVAELILENYRNASAEIEYDFSHIDVKMMITIGKIKIGIESQGDPGSRLESSLKEFVKKNCDMIICCTRTSGATVNAVYNLRKMYDIIWVTNFRSEQKDNSILNEMSAQNLFELVQNLLGNKV